MTTAKERAARRVHAAAVGVPRRADVDDLEVVICAHAVREPHTQVGRDATLAVPAGREERRAPARGRRALVNALEYSPKCL